MKLVQLLFCTAGLIAASYTSALSQECPQGFLGTKALYTAPLSQGTAVPDGYRPVFINHIGRHGARHLTKEVHKTLAWQLVMRADSLDALSAEGIRLKQMLIALDQVELNHVESISEEGVKELHEIGKRMEAGNRELFSKSLKVNVAVTQKKRTKQSADAFLTGFSQPASLHEYIDDTNLRFYDLSPAYLSFEKEGDWIGKLQSLKETEGIPAIQQTLVEKLFKPSFLKALQPAQRVKLTDDIFGFATIVYSLQYEIKAAGFQPDDLNFGKLFSCAELIRLGKIDEAEDFLTKGPGTNISGIQVKIAVPLLINFIKTTDEFIKNPQFDIQLRFAHAETVAPFAALLAISSADKSTGDLNKVNWKAAAVAPLSSNIQWIIYHKKGNKDYLVKVLLNEKEAYITGMNQKQFPYYSYTELRSLYLDKLKGLGIKLNDNMDMYLKNVGTK